MLRKITFAILILFTISAFGQQRKRTVGSGGMMDAALAPMAVPGTTASGTVTAVNGNIISLANGAVTIDASNAKIIDDRGNAGSTASITVGTEIFAVLNVTTVAANAPLPATTIAVHHQAQVELTGPVDAKGSDSLNVLGRTIKVDANTSFGGRARSLADIVVGDIVMIQANAAGSALVATSVMSMTPMPKTPTVIHGTVKNIGADSWTITDNAGKDWTIIVDAQTKIIGTPKAGDTVEILVNTNNANQYVAISIMKSPLVLPLVVFSGEVQSIGADAWVIHDQRSNKDVKVAVNAKTEIIGNPHVNDGVNVTASVDSAGNYTAVTIFKLGIVPSTMTFSGTVKAIDLNPMANAPCPTPGCDLAFWTIGPSVGMGPDMRVRVNGQTKVYANPQVGDRVKVLGQMTSTGILAIEITKQ